jgi:hypothetical protein
MVPKDTIKGFFDKNLPQISDDIRQYMTGFVF